MSQSRTVSVVLFVLGLVLIGVGTGLSNVSETGMTTRGPWTSYPYLGAGAAVIIVGTVVLAVAHLMIALKKAVSTTAEMPKTELQKRALSRVSYLLVPHLKRETRDSPVTIKDRI